MSHSSGSVGSNRVVCVGSNFFGQLGIGPEERKRPSFCPVDFGSATNGRKVGEGAGAGDDILVQEAADIQCGSNFTALLDARGDVHVCGSMSGTIMPYLVRAQMTYPIKCTQIACGRKHIVALGENGFVLSWGTGHFGQLGHGDDSNYDRPKIISALEPRRIGSRAVGVSCGGSHSGVITNSGMVFMWGLNRVGQTGTSSKQDSVVEPLPIDTGDIIGGTAVAAALVCGRNHTTMVTGEGRVYTWGAATFGRLGLADGRKKVMRPSEIKFFASRPVASVASGDFHNLALCRSGEVYSWGHNLEGQCGVGTAVNVKTPKKIDFFGPELRIKEICCGSSWCVAVSSSGRAYSWGHGDGGWLCLPSPVPPLLDEPSVQRVIPYIDSTPEDPCPGSGLMHTRSFDSCHNVLLPRPVRIPFPDDMLSTSTTTTTAATAATAQPGDECVVQSVRCGGGHMLLYLSRQKKRRGAVPGARTQDTEVAERKQYSSSGTVDSKSESKSTRVTSTSTSEMMVAGKEEDGEGERDPEDRCLALGMIHDGAWMFGEGSGAGAGAGAGIDLYSITHHTSTGFTVSGSFGTTAKTAPQPPGLDGIDDEKLQSVIFSWSRHNKVPELAYALLNRGIFVDSRDASANTPLMVACQNGHLGVCQMLVEQAKAGLNLKNGKGNTALHFCFAFGFQSLGEYLISKGADEFLTNVDGLTCYEGLCAADLERF
jgi:alpha-tubulin suppressor-like RCC1 family protein